MCSQASLSWLETPQLKLSIDPAGLLTLSVFDSWALRSLFTLISLLAAYLGRFLCLHEASLIFQGVKCHCCSRLCTSGILETGSLGFCVISSATNVPCNAFFVRDWPWLSGLVTSSAPSSTLGSHTTSSVFILTQLRCGKRARYELFLGQMLEETAQSQDEQGIEPRCLWLKWIARQDHLTGED